MVEVLTIPITTVVPLSTSLRVKEMQKLYNFCSPDGQRPLVCYPQNV